MGFDDAHLFWMSADGTGDVERLLTDDVVLSLSPQTWTPDGSMLLFSGDYPGRMSDIGVISMTGDRNSEFLIQTEFIEDHAVISPDGGWIAYTSRRSGRREVYVERFPDLGGRRLISTDGGRLPLWSPDGSELFYTTLDNTKLMVVSIDAARGFTAGAPDVWFEGNLFFAGHRRTYDVAPDGQRLVLLLRNVSEAIEDDARPELVVVQNWLAEH